MQYQNQKQNQNQNHQKLNQNQNRIYRNIILKLNQIMKKKNNQKNHSVKDEDIDIRNKSEESSNLSTKDGENYINNK